MLCRLKHALGTDSVNLKYQPIYSPLTETIVGVEALLRWHDPFFGRIGPETLLGLASSNGLMDTLSGYVIKKAISQMADLMRDHILFLSLNLAPADLISGTSTSILFSELTRHHLPPGSIMLELTEEQCSRPDTLAKQAARLAQRGFQLALDDFGKGCSNFDRLLGLPVSTVKIDRDLTQTLFSQGPRQKQILGICHCLYQLPNRVIFEGIETEAQSAFIAEHFPDAWAQGWYFAKAMSPESVRRLLTHQQ